MKQTAYTQWQESRDTFARFEQTILSLYEKQALTPGLLDRTARQYRLLDIDSAGSRSLRTRDGKDLFQVCIELLDPSFPLALPGSSEDHEAYWEEELRKWEEIVSLRWGWHGYGAGPSPSDTQDAAA